MTFRCGDHVLHLPTGEMWLVAYVDGDDLAWCGWPDGLARTSDCLLVKACDDAEHIRMLKEVAQSRTGRRAGYAQRELDKLRDAAEQADTAKALNVIEQDF